MKNRLAYFIAKSSMFSIGFFLLLQSNGKNAYISIILGTLIGIIIIYLYSLIKKYLGNSLLIDKLKETKLGKLYILIFIIFYLLLITINLLVLTIFVNSFYLINTPKLMIIIPFLLIATYLAYKKDDVLTNLSCFLFWISIFVVIVFSFLLIPYFEFNELLPLFNYQGNSIVKGTIYYAALTSIPQILVIDYYKNYKDMIKDYLIASILNLFIILGTIFALGDSLIKVYSFPEYDVLKQIKILDFIENIENISAFGWYSELFMMLTTLINNLKKSLPKKGNKLLITILLSTIVFISSFIIGGNYILNFKIFYSYPFILIAFCIIFLSLLLFLKYKKNDT